MSDTLLHVFLAAGGACIAILLLPEVPASASTLFGVLIALSTIIVVSEVLP